MRTRRLTCPLSAHRKQLESEYFEKSVKRSLPKWLNKLRQWEENRSRNKNIHVVTNNLTAVAPGYKSNNDDQNIDNCNEQSEIPTLMVPHI